MRVAAQPVLAHLHGDRARRDCDAGELKGEPVRQLQPDAEVEDPIAVRPNRTCPAPADIALSAPIDLSPEVLDHLVRIRVHLKGKTHETCGKVRASRIQLTSVGMGPG
jgi:hypothetical protein